MSSLSLSTLISRYPILSLLAIHISTLDLFRLSLTCRTLHTYIQPSTQLFKSLTRQSLCDGRGLIQRQEFKEQYHIDYKHRRYQYGPNRSRRNSIDEPIEVRLWGTKCKEYEALPCVMCGVNVCEECRFCEREKMMSGELYRRPFPHPNWEHGNFFAACEGCDRKLQEEVEERWSYVEECACDAYVRWICGRCERKEKEFGREYSEKCMKWVDDYGFAHDNFVDWREAETDEGRIETKIVGVHQHAVGVMCLCGNTVPESMRLRCTWCKRRHPPEHQWFEVANAMALEHHDGVRLCLEAARTRNRRADLLVQDYKSYDPCYPSYSQASAGGFYQPLPYNGPIWSEGERVAFVAANQTR